MSLALEGLSGQFLTWFVAHIALTWLPIRLISGISQRTAMRFHNSEGAQWRVELCIPKGWRLCPAVLAVESVLIFW